METEHLDTRLELRSIDETSGTFTGIASVFGELDSYNDVVAPGAFSATLKARKASGVKMLWQHWTSEPIGVWTTIQEDKKGLLVEGKLVLETQRGGEAHALLKAGALDGLSIGFMSKKSEMDEETYIRTLKEIDLWEISLVTFPALSSAQVTDVKASVPFQDLPLAARDLPWKRSAADKRVRAWAGAEKGPNARYRKAFLWYDKEKPEDFASYKLQIADVREGT